MKHESTYIHTYLEFIKFTLFYYPDWIILIITGVQKSRKFEVRTIVEKPFELSCLMEHPVGVRVLDWFRKSGGIIVLKFRKIFIFILKIAIKMVNGWLNYMNQFISNKL